MLMPNRLKRASVARLAVGLAVLAFPLLATSVAQASVAFAIPSTTTVRPDLRSATIDPTEGPTGVHVCFDKTLNSLVSSPDFFLAGYRAGRQQTAMGGAFAEVDPSNTMCVLVSFPAAAGDINNYTVLTVTGGAVRNNSGPLAPNLPDSVALTGSTSHSGTRGVTSAPNLVGVLAPSGTNQLTHSLTYVFDKDTHVVNPSRFLFETANGGVCTGLAVLSGQDSNVITVEFNDGAPPFPPNLCNGVVNAVKAGIFAGGTTAVYDTGSTNADVLTNLPTCGSPCSTSRPDLLSAVINPVSDSITYTFDHNVVLTNASGFEAEFSNGQTLNATGALCNGSTVCTAQFSGNLSKQSEYAVGSWVGLAAVVAADNISSTGLNLPGYAPVGGNPGAFASGFTTGPDVFGINIDKTSGAVSVNLDSRVKTVALSGSGKIVLLDGAGNPIVSSYTPNFNSSAPPGPETVTLNYPPSILTNATQVAFLGSNTGAAFTSPFTQLAPPNATAPADNQNVDQIVGTVPTGAILKGYHAYMKKHHIKRHHTR